MIKLDILSDPICPWCYIGKAHLDKALAKSPDHPFEIEWHPFQLNPDMPPAGMDRRSYLETKFGGKKGAIEVYSRIEEAAVAADLEIDFSAIKRTPNTLDAHRLIHWAGLEGRQTAAVSSLFKAYFTQGHDIGDSETLLDIAEKIGMERAVTQRLLSGDADGALIAQRDAHARSRGVTGVPTHIISNKHVLPGAQPPELWAEIISDIEKQMQADT